MSRGVFLQVVGETFCVEFEVYTLDNYARFATAVAEVPGFKIFGFKSLGRFRVAEVISN